MEKRTKNNEKDKNGPILAPGLDDQDELEQKASSGEIARGDYTNVTTLSYDEVDPS